MADSLAAWRNNLNAQIATVQKKSADKGIQLKTYAPFMLGTERQPLLRIRRGTIQAPDSALSYQYGYIFKVVDDEYGFNFTIVYNLPVEGHLAIQFLGEGLTPLLDGILTGRIKEIQIFDPERFITPPEGTFDVEANEWVGPPVIREIIVTSLSPQT